MHYDHSPAVKEWEKSYQPPVIHLGRVLSVGDGIARVYGLKSVQVRRCMKALQECRIAGVG